MRGVTGVPGGSGMDLGEVSACGACRQMIYSGLGHACPGKDSLMVHDTATGTDLPLPLAEVIAGADRYLILVWDETAASFVAVPRMQAGHGDARLRRIARRRDTSLRGRLTTGA